MQVSRLNYYPALISVCLIALIFAGRQIVDMWHGQVDSVGHIEAVSLSLYGRFHGTALITDPYSGEFPTFYNFLSDWLINLIARVTGLPAFSAQAVIYVPFLTAFLFIGTYLSVRAVEVDRGVALLAAVLVVASAETPFVHYLYPLLERFSGMHAPTGNLIPPAQAIGVASSQGFGWGWFLPTLAALYCAKRRDEVLLTFFAGALLGICCLAHTLTFLQVATTVSVYVAVDAIVARFREGRTVDAIVRLAAIVVLTVFVAKLSQKTGLSMSNFVIFWAGCFAVSLKDVRSLRFTMIYGIGAVVVASPYLFQIWQLSLQVSRFGESYDSPIAKTEFVLFYLAYIVCGVVVLLNARRLARTDILIWLAVMLIVSVGLGYGKIFGFQNHEYRFLTNAIIPFAVLAAFVLTIPQSVSRKVAVFGLVPLLLVGVVRNLWAVASPLPEPIIRTVGTFSNYNKAIPLPAGAPALLDRIRAETATSPGSRLLLPPEYEYPQQAYRNGLLLAVSSVPGLIADPRFIVWYDIYADRVAVFCSLFPTYRHFDAHTRSRLCEETPKELATGYLGLINVGASADVLSLYGIELMALLQGPQDSELAARAASLGMKLIHEADGGMLWRTTPKPDPERISFGAATYSAPELSIPVVAPQAGSYVIVLAGRALSTRIRQIRLAGKAIELRPLGGDAIGLSADLPAGSSQLSLELTAEPRYRFVFPTPIRQIVGINREAAAKFLAGPALQELLR